MLAASRDGIPPAAITRFRKLFALARNRKGTDYMKAISTHYVGPTNTRGARIIASDGDGNRCTISYPHELSGTEVHASAALALCRKKAWKGELVAGEVGNDYVFVWVNGSERFTAK